MERFLGAVLIIILLILAEQVSFNPQVVIADEKQVNDDVVTAQQPIITQSKFKFKLQQEIESIPKKTVYTNDPNIDAELEQVTDEGQDGRIDRVIRITYYEGQEYSREVDSEKTTPAKDKQILRGTKIVWKTLDTPDGQISYWKRMRVYATHYDSHCPGCDEWTATGMRQGKGVIAVDPRVIPLRSRVYVPGYGPAIAGDTGGAIKGKIIDLGFEDARTAGWYAHYVDIYLL